MNWSGLDSLAPYFAIVVAIGMPLLVQRLTAKSSRKIEKWKTYSSQLRSALEQVHKLRDDMAKGKWSLLTRSEIEGMTVRDRLKEVQRMLEPRLSKDEELSEHFAYGTHEYSSWYQAGLGGAGELKHLFGTFIHDQSIRHEISDSSVEQLYKWLRREVNNGSLQRIAYDNLEARLSTIQKALERRI